MKDDEIKYTYEEVVSFCKTSEIRIAPRVSTFQFINKAGQSVDDVINEVRQLKVDFACAEPELDYGENRKGYVYQFKKLVFERYWFYIKLKMKIDQEKIVWVLSFHEEEFDYGFRSIKH